MATKEKWVELFEKVANRKPTKDEFLAGKSGGFNPIDIRQIAGLDPVVSTQDMETPDVLDISEESFVNTDKTVTDDISEDSFVDADETVIDDIWEESFAISPSSDNLEIVDVEQKTADNLSAQQAWVKTFEKYVGRKPTADEFLVGKQADFDLTAIHRFIAQSSKPSPKWVGSPMSKKKKILIGIGVVFALVLLFGLRYGFNYFSRESVAERYVQVVGKDLDDALSYEVWSDTNKTIKKSDLTYTDEKHMSTITDVTTLLSGSHMKQVGRKYLIFPDWRVVVTPVDATVSSNTKGLTINVNGKKFKETDSESFKKTLEHLYPGDYEFTATGTVNDQSITVSSEQTLSKDSDIELDVTYLNFKVESNLTDGDLYLGSIKLGTLSSGEYSASNTPVTKSSKLYVQKSFDDGSVLKSETMDVSDVVDGDTITLDAEGVLDRDTADDLIEAAYSKLQSYASSHTTPDALTDIFKDGNSNSMYSDVVNMIETNTTNAKNRSASSISFNDIDVTNVKQTGATTYTADFTVVYSFYYSYSSEHKSSGYIKQKMSWSANIEYKDDSDDDDDYSLFTNYYDDYIITGKNGESSVISTDNTVS